MLYFWDDETARIRICPHYKRVMKRRKMKHIYIQYSFHKYWMLNTSTHAHKNTSYREHTLAFTLYATQEIECVYHLQSHVRAPSHMSVMCLNITFCLKVTNELRFVSNIGLIYCVPYKTNHKRYYATRELLIRWKIWNENCVRHTQSNEKDQERIWKSSTNCKNQTDNFLS